MKPLILVVALLMLIARLAAQLTIEITKGYEFGPEHTIREEHDRGGKDLPAGNRGDGNSPLGPDKIGETLLASVNELYKCGTGKNALNTIAEKMVCFNEALKAKGLPSREVLIAKFKEDPEAARIFGDILEGRHDADTCRFIPDRNGLGKIGLQLNPSEIGLSHCNFSAISTDGKPTSFTAANYDQAGTQKQVDNLRVIDPHAEIHFNDPKIVGVKQDNDREHDGKVHVAWSSDPLSLEGAKLLAKSNPITVTLLLALTPDKREEALAEYSEFDLSFAQEYLKVGASDKFQAVLKALEEREQAWKKEERDLSDPVAILNREWKKGPLPREDAIQEAARILSAAREKHQEKLLAWNREKAEFTLTVATCTIECLKACDPTAITATIKVAQEKTKSRSNCGGGGYPVSEQEGKFTFVIEVAKNHDLLACMAALKALEEKCCEPAEAERRKTLRETKAAARRKARYEAVKAKIQAELERKCNEAWLREQNKNQKISTGHNDTHEIYGDSH